MLCLSVKLGDAVLVGDVVVKIYKAKSPNSWRLSFDGPPETEVYHERLLGDCDVCGAANSPPFGRHADGTRRNVCYGCRGIVRDAG